MCVIEENADVYLNDCYSEQFVLPGGLSVVTKPQETKPELLTMTSCLWSGMIPYMPDAGTQYLNNCWHWRKKRSNSYRSITTWCFSHRKKFWKNRCQVYFFYQLIISQINEIKIRRIWLLVKIVCAHYYFCTITIWEMNPLWIINYI